MNQDDFLFVSGLFKARPAEEAGERVLYMEASNEHVDLQGERVLAKSLRESSDHFLAYGNLDLDHRTLLPPRGAGDNPYLWEIGRPVEVTSDADRTMVKAVLYKGDGRVAENANMVWESMVGISPPARWYPSVGGQILERGTAQDPLTKADVRVVKRVRWTNIGLSRTPVNQALPPVSTIPAEVFVEIGLDLKKRHAPTFTVSLANAYHGYLPTPEQHALGGYETWRARSSCLEVGASTKMVDALDELFERLGAAHQSACSGFFLPRGWNFPTIPPSRF
jgi:hypothetical protein